MAPTPSVPSLTVERDRLPYCPKDLPLSSTFSRPIEVVRGEAKNEEVPGCFDWVERDEISDLVILFNL